MSKVPTLLSPEYQQLLKDTHAQGPWGNKGFTYIKEFMPHFRELSCKSLLDYGSGLETVRQKLELSDPDVQVHCYDPGIVGREATPNPADFVVCTDVMEHLEPEYVTDTVKHLHSLTLKGGYFCIAHLAAKRILPDGRNAHLLQKGTDWWLQVFQKHDWQIIKKDAGLKSLRLWIKQ